MGFCGQLPCVELRAVTPQGDTVLASLLLMHAEIALTESMAQLEDNVKALDVMTMEERARLDALTQPKFGFPQNMQPMFPSIHHGGATVNGISAPISHFVIGAGETPH
jgi:hypothetical protein